MAASGTPAFRSLVTSGFAASGAIEISSRSRFSG